VPAQASLKEIDKKEKKDLLRVENPPFACYTDHSFGDGIISC
jgi:hypothetical protein